VLVVVQAVQKCGIEKNCAKSTIRLLSICMMKLYSCIHYNMLFLNFFHFESLTITVSASPYPFHGMNIYVHE